MEFVRVGGHFDPRVGGEEMGYDGQFSYQIAKDPLHAWNYVDIPAYRYQRILFPMIVRVVSIGHELLIPWAMLFVNFVALVGGVYILERILLHFNKSIWYALIYGLYVGTLLSFRLGLNEILAYVFVLFGVLTWFQKRYWLAIMLFSLGVLSKEITVLFLAAFSLSYLSVNRRKAIMWLIVGIAPMVLWKVILFSFFHDWGLNSGGAMASSFEWIPYYGWWKMVFYSLPSFAVLSMIIVPLVVLPSAIGIWLSSRRIFNGLLNEGTLALLFTSILIPFLPTSNILDPLGISRAMIGLVISYIVFGARQDNRKVLNFCLLFCITALFIWKDSFIPMGTFH